MVYEYSKWTLWIQYIIVFMVHVKIIILAKELYSWHKSETHPFLLYIIAMSCRTKIAWIAWKPFQQFHVIQKESSVLINCKARLPSALSTNYLHVLEDTTTGKYKSIFRIYLNQIIDKIRDRFLSNKFEYAFSFFLPLMQRDSS